MSKRLLIVASLTAIAIPYVGALAAGDQPAQKPAMKQPAKQAALDAVPGAGEADPLTPAETSGPLLAPGAPSEAKPVEPAAQLDPIVAEIRKRLADARPSGSASDKADRAGLAAFYAEWTSAPLWTGPDGFTPRARKAMAEIAKADDWGLSADAFELPSPPANQSGSQSAGEALADAEIKLGLAVLKYARHARGGRIDPQSVSRLLDHKPRLYEPRSLMQAIATAEAPDDYLRKLHPRHPQFERLRQALLATRGAKPAAADERPDVKIPAGPRIKPGQQHPHVALIRQRLKVAAETGKEAVYDDALVKAIIAYQGDHGQEPTGIFGNDTRTVLNGTARRTPTENVQRIIVNMERWRWLPDDLGSFHVMDSITEQMTRVVKDGKVVLAEKIVVGKVSTPTPQFTANMQFVIFHPSWGVPDGIKMNELAPLLRRADNSGNWFFGGGGRTAASVLEGVGGLRPSINGQPVNPDSVNWSQVDMRRVSFTQPPGSRNVLGVVKFRFPNKHDVYMHDTPERHLFNSGLRAFSHGCMRVQNPVRLAEVLLEHDKGWSAEKVSGYVRGSGGGSNEIKLTTPIPVHITYFTMQVGEDGKLNTFGDLYGLDSRIASALAGKQIHIASAERTDRAERSEASPAAADPGARIERQVRPRPRTVVSRQQQPGAPFNNPFLGLFGN